MHDGSGVDKQSSDMLGKTCLQPFVRGRSDCLCGKSRSDCTSVESRSDCASVESRSDCASVESRSDCTKEKGRSRNCFRAKKFWRYCLSRVNQLWSAWVLMSTYLCVGG